MPEANGKESEFEIKLEKKGRLARRKTLKFPGGLYFFEDELRIDGRLSATVITCSAWLVEFFNVRSGDVFLTSGTKQIRPRSTDFGILYPPFTITRPTFSNLKSRLTGIAGSTRLPDEFIKSPLLFETELNEPPQNFESIVSILDSSRNRQAVEISPDASLLSLKAKRLIDENYRIYPSIARIAARLDVSHEHLTRQFKRDFALSPNAYLHQLRIADANFRLALGEKIIRVSNEVGYNDLSRFYKQFRKSNTVAPGTCRTILKPKINIKKRQDF